MTDRHPTVSPWAVGLSSFAGFLMILSGIFQALQGLAAVINERFFVVGMEYVYRFDVTTWGWVHLILGTIIAFAGGAVLSHQAWGRVIGIILAIMSAIANFFYMPYYPFWAILIIALDIGIIWALSTYGPEDVVV